MPRPPCRPPAPLPTASRLPPVVLARLREARPRLRRRKRRCIDWLRFLQRAFQQEASRWPLAPFEHRCPVIWWLHLADIHAVLPEFEQDLFEAAYARTIRPMVARQTLAGRNNHRTLCRLRSRIEILGGARVRRAFDVELRNAGLRVYPIKIERKVRTLQPVYIWVPEFLAAKMRLRVIPDLGHFRLARARRREDARWWVTPPRPENFEEP